MNWLRKQVGNILIEFNKRSFYYVFLVVSILIISLLFYYHIDDLFSKLYQINYEAINSATLTFFSVLFGFIFTILSLLFTLSEDSYFFKLVKQNNKSKKDVVGYFSFSIFLVVLVLIVSLILTVTYYNNENNVHDFVLSDNMNNINCFLIKMLVFLIPISIVCIFLLLLFFIIIIST